jgi:hypothetical protein
MSSAIPLMDGNSPASRLAGDLIDQIETLILDAEESGKPLEVDPQRAQLFDLFAQADAAGFLAEGASPDLSSDAVAKELASRWNLRNLGAAISQPTALPAAQFARLRVLWSFLRMWMEWSYAWERWAEFKRPQPTGEAAPAGALVNAPPGDPD